MLTRQEREQNVLDLYNQGNTIRDIAKEARMSFRDIGAVLKKEEKEKERQKRKLDNNKYSTDSDSNRRGLSLSTQAYELFSLGKNPIQAAIELNLRESQVTRYYKEYWKPFFERWRLWRKTEFDPENITSWQEWLPFSCTI